MLIAYFCAEFALINDLPTYAGGLGILAGDFMLEAADEKFPMVGIGLYYKKGQNAKTRTEKSTDFKLVKIKNKRLLIEIPIEDRNVRVQVWQWKRKNNSVYFLDTDILENNITDRLITEQLYVENRDLRLKQELILGIGGVRLLRNLNLKPDLYHLNEGHSAFLGLELIGREINRGLTFSQALLTVKKKIVFTNHTLVLEGQELFAFDALTKITDKLCRDLNIDIQEFIECGKGKRDDTLFSMTTLALNLATLTNAVSKIHGEKAQESWPGCKIIHITNGIYVPRWDKIEKNNIIKAHENNEEKLLRLIKKVHGDDWKKDALLIGWSRRFVPYKRPLALLEDVGKLRQLAEYFKGKIHIVYSAPLDKKNVNNNEFLRRLFDLMNGELKGLITFIPNYRIEVAETLVAGCDIWLNTPIVGREACGTSGMKAALNGTLTLSTNDGWISEVPVDNNYGWILDDQDVTNSILETLEKKVLPLYEKFQKRNNGSEWKKYMEKSRALILKDFSAKRMLREYNEKLYQPIIKSNSVKNKKLVAFDVDGTLAEPRQMIDRKIANLLKQLLKNKKVAVISGGAFEHIKKQVLDRLKISDNLKKNLILLPTNGSGLYIFDKNWQEISSRNLTAEEKEKVITALQEVDQADPELKDNISYGQEIQDRRSSITYSALGENAPVELKKGWDPDFKRRLALQDKLNTKLPDFEVKIGGTTSIDITPKGVDKAYGINKLLTYLNLDKSDAIFFGDAVYQNGNDFPVLQMGVETIKVSGPRETKIEIIKNLR